MQEADQRADPNTRDEAAIGLQHRDDRIVEVALEVDAEAASRDRREVDVDGGGRRTAVLGELVHQDRRAVGIEPHALPGGETMEPRRRSHALLEQCHALDRRWVRVRWGDALGYTDGGNPPTLAGTRSTHTSRKQTP